MKTLSILKFSLSTNFFSVINSLSFTQAEEDNNTCNIVRLM